MPRRAAGPIALLVLLASFAVGYAHTSGASGMFMWDEAEYAVLGRSLARGDGYTIDARPVTLRPPGLPLSIAAGVTLAGRDGDGVARAPLLLWALAALAAAAWGARRAWGWPAGLASAALLGATPIFWQHTGLVLTEVPYMACFTAAVWHLHLALDGARRSWIWSGIAVGLALHFRYTAVLYAPIALAFMLPLALRERGAFLRRVLATREPWLGLAAAIAIQLPWLIRQAVVHGDPLAGFKAAVAQFPAWATMPWHTYLSGLPEALTWPVTVLAAAGAGLAIWRRDAAALRCLVAAAVIVGWLSAYSYKEMRLVSSAVPFLAALGGYVVAAFRPRRVAAAAIALAVGFAAWTSLTQVPRVKTVGHPVFTAALAALRGATPGAVMGASTPQIVWYADRHVVRFPRDVSALPAALAGVEWVVLVNFERGQPAYVAELMRKLRKDDDPDEVMHYFGGPYHTYIVRAALLRARLGG